MAVEVGQKVEGKITGIKHFGAFVALGNNQSGLIHISEISDEFIKDINDVLSMGDEVTVKVLTVANDGKIGLSLRQAAEDNPDLNITKTAPKREHKPEQSSPKGQPRNFHQVNPTVPRTRRDDRQGSRPNQNVSGKYAQKNNDDFDSLMSNFLKDSEDRLSSLRRNTEGKRGGRGGRRT